MTEGNQLPLDCPSDDEENQPDTDVRGASIDACVDLSACERGDQTDSSTDATTLTVAALPANRSAESSTPKEHGLAREPSESVTVRDGANELSEKATGAVSDCEPTPPVPSVYFLTNRMNLNGVLSSRLVAPRESFHKYYADLLQQTPGWVPLLRDVPTSALIEAVTSEEGAGAPVLIEFPIDVLGMARADASVAYVPALALSKAVAVHFPSEHDLREHRARVYSNVHPHDELLRVTPELFQSEAFDRTTLDPPSQAPAIDWRRIDRIRGAVNAAIASVTSGEQLAIAAAVVGATGLPAAVSVPAWFRWFDLDDHADPDARPGPDRAQPDYVGFRAAYDVLGDRDVSEAWSPNEVLDAVESHVRAACLTDDIPDDMARNLYRVRSIVNVEADFEPFRPSARALVSAKALLLVLLRQELDQLLDWPDDETGADDLTRVVAATLAGRLRGLSRESTELRSLELDDLTAAWAVRVAFGGSAMIGEAQFVVNARRTALKVDGVEIAYQGALLPDLVSKYQMAADAQKVELRIKVSRAMGWPVEHRVQVPADASVESFDSLITIATSDEVVVEVFVDEDGFVRRLGSLTGGERLRAAEALRSWERGQ